MNSAHWDFGLKKELLMVDENIKKNTCSELDILREISAYVLKSGGKRIRPAVVINSYKAVGNEPIERIIPMAAVFEMIHTATLIHDDIIDGSPFRRGIDTVYYKYGVQKAIVTGDYLFIRAFQMGGSYGKEVVDLTSEACTGLAEGEMLETVHHRDANLPEDTYYEIITKKTALPFSASAAVGGYIGKGTEEQVEALKRYGLNIGMTFQIVDDILDVTGNSSSIGKPVGLDIVQGNATLLTIYAMKHASEEDKARLERIMSTNSSHTTDVETALDILKSSGSVEYARSKASEFTEKAKEQLASFPESEAKENLLKISDYVLNRAD